jgi:outer membrane lipoprotein LolB
MRLSLTTLPLKVGILLLSFLTLSSCSLFKTRAELPQNLSPESRERFLQRQQYWKVTGRIGITTPEESNSASFTWEKDQDSIKLRIYGSFGVTYAHLTAEPGQAKIELSDDQVYYDTDAEQLLWRTTGWQIPVQKMQYWILGIPAQAPDFELNKEGYLSELRYGYWLVNYQSYQSFDGLIMPKKLRVIHPEVTLKFSIHQWHFVKDQ